MHYKQIFEYEFLAQQHAHAVPNSSGSSFSFREKKNKNHQPQSFSILWEVIDFYVHPNEKISSATFVRMP